MKRLTKFLLAMALALGFAPAIALNAANNDSVTKTEASSATLHTLVIGGYIGGDVNSNIGSARFNPYDHTWDYYASSNMIILRNYVGPQIAMICDTPSFAPIIRLEGECIINVTDQSAPGILFETFSGKIVGNIIFDTPDASLTIIGGSAGVSFVNSDSFEEKRLSIVSQSESLNRFIIDSRTGINLGSENSYINISSNIDLFIRSQKFGINVQTEMTKIGDNYYSRAKIVMPAEESTLTIIAGEQYSLPLIRGNTVAVPFYRQTINNTSDLVATAGEFVSNDYLVYSISTRDNYMKSLLRFTDEEGKLRPSKDNGQIKVDLGDTKVLGFNSVPLSNSLNGYKIVKSIDFRKNGAEEPIYADSNDNSNPLSYTFTPSDRSLHVLKNTLQLTKDNVVVCEVKELVRVTTITTHTISTSVSGLKIDPVSHPSAEVKTGETFTFFLIIEEYYLNNGLDLYYQNLDTGESKELGSLHQSTYTISNITGDIDIFSDKVLDYTTTFDVYAGDKFVERSARRKGIPYTLPNLTDDYIPSGYTFDYWIVGDRPNHYAPGTDIYFTEAERGELRIEAHFAGLVYLWNEADYFYSGIDCTPAQKIRTCKPTDDVYFKLPYYGEVNPDTNRVLDSFTLSGSCASYGRVSGDIFYVQEPSTDITIYAKYKDPIDEIVAENVVIPVGGEPLIERSFHAPADAGYIIQEASNRAYKIEGDTRKWLYTFDDDNPYIFENGGVYEFEFEFRIPSDKNFILNPNGYLRDGGCQITIDGLEESDYEIVSADFTNISKESYQVILRMTALDAYEINVDGGHATVNGNTVGHAVVDSDVILVADPAPSGKAFDRWIVEGVTVEEESLGGSRLYFKMPNNVVTATATYKDVSYFTIVFDANGGTGTIADDITYGIYTLPPCSYTAPEHKHFVAWDIDGTQYDEYEDVHINKNVTVRAIWEWDQVTLSFNSNGGSGTMSPVTKDYNSSFDLPENGFAAPSHKHFAGWSYSASGDIITDDAITLTEDTELFAIWVIDTHTVSFEHSEGASGSMAPVIKEYGSTYELPTPTFVPEEGKEFKYWMVNGLKTIETSITIDGDIVLTAVYGDIAVEPVVLEQITLSGSYKTEFKVGDKFTYDGLVVTASYSDGTSVAVSGFTVSSPDMTTAGTKTVTVSYTENEVTKTATYQIKVSENSPITPTPDEPSNNGRRGLPGGAIAAIIIVSILVVGIGAFALIWFVIKKKTWADFIAIFKKK